MDDKENLVHSLEKLEIELKNNEAELEAVEDLIGEYENSMSTLEDTQHIMDKIKYQREAVKNSEELYDANMMKALNYVVTKSPGSLLEPFQVSTATYLETIYESETNVVPLPLLNKSILNNKCECCGLSLDEHIEAYNRIKNLQENYEHNNINEFVSQLLFHYKTMSAVEINNTIDDYIKLEFSNRSRLDQNNLDLDSMESQLKKKSESVTDVELLYNNKATAEKDRITLIGKSAVLNDSKETLTEKLNNIIREITVATQKDSALKMEQAVKVEITQAYEALSKVSKEYSEETREHLSQSTTEILKDLIDSNDTNLISKIDINNKYEIKIFDQGGNQFSQDISQGQRKIASIAFIMALTKFAAQSVELDTHPFFMDTPFANLDLNHRKQLIDKLPSQMSQWMLLLTDTEMSYLEEEHFKATGTVGSWYRLKKVDDFHTQIEYVPIHEKMTREGL